MARHRVLIVEDEQDIAGLIKHTLERGGETEAQIVGSGDAALKAVTERLPDLIILYLILSWMFVLVLHVLSAKRTKSAEVKVVL